MTKRGYPCGILFLFACHVRILIGESSVGDMNGCVDGVNGELGFVLFITNGFIDFLEGYSTTLDIWPNDKEIELLYDGANGKRDYEKLKSSWEKKD